MVHLTSDLTGVRMHSTAACQHNKESDLEELQKIAQHLELESSGCRQLQRLPHGSSSSRLQKSGRMCNEQQAQPFKRLLLHFQAALKRVVEGEQGVQQLADVQCGRARRCSVLQYISTMADQLTHNKQKPAASKDASKGAMTSDGCLAVFSALHTATAQRNLGAADGKSWPIRGPWICLC